MGIKNTSVRLDSELFEKLHVVADYEGRSLNGQIMVLVRGCIEQFEERHGKIEIQKAGGVD